jgi:hypothetical protein
MTHKLSINPMQNRLEIISLPRIFGIKQHHKLKQNFKSMFELTASEMYADERQLVEWLLSSHLVRRAVPLMAMKAANVKRAKPMTTISLQRNNFAIDIELSACLLSSSILRLAACGPPQSCG